MGSVGKGTVAAAASPNEPYAWEAEEQRLINLSESEHDIEDLAEQLDFDSAEEMVQTAITNANDFWTTDEDMLESVREAGYEVIDEPNGESFVVVDPNDTSDSEFVVYYNTAGSSRYITRVRKA